MPTCLANNWLTCISNGTVSTNDALVDQLDAATFSGAWARLAVVRGTSNRVAIVTLGAELAVATGRVVTTDAEP